MRGRRRRRGDRAGATVTTVATARALRFAPAGDDGVAQIVIDRPDDAVNAVNPRFVEDLAEAIQQARAAAPRGLIITSAKKDQWIAGADLKLVTQTDDAHVIEAAGR